MFDLANLPPKLTLACSPTPLHRLRGGARRWHADIWVKRDDLTGCALSGNKIRKLEFLLADARARGAGAVVTCGGAQSNHARATALAAARLGLRCHLVLRGDEPKRVAGNTLLDRLAGATVRWVDTQTYGRGVALLEEEAAALAEREQTRAYVIPEGGSNGLGAVGYVVAAAELARQLYREGLQIDAVVVACGSGGTLAGLAAGHALWPDLLPPPVGIAVCYDPDYFRRVAIELAREALELCGVHRPPARPAVGPILDAVGLGYALLQRDDVAAIEQMASGEGIVLGPAYTGKAWAALQRALAQGTWPLGRRIVFVHTGGIFAVFSRAQTWAQPLAHDEGTAQPAPTHKGG